MADDASVALSTNDRPRPLSVALVGAGRVAREYHVPCLKAAGVRVTAVVDPDPEARRRVSALVPGAIALREVAELHGPIDCAVVCTPPAAHAGPVRWLAEHGIHVLCEKPLACTERDAAQLVEVARVGGVVLQVGYYRRFHPAAQRVGAWIEEGKLGRPRRATLVGGHIQHPREASPSLMDVGQSGGGVMMDVGVHVVDRLLSWFAALTLREYLDDRDGGMEANALVRLEARAGEDPVPITILLSRTSDLGYHGAVEFEDGTVVCALNAGHALTVFTPADARSPRIVETGELRTAAGYFRDQWAEFAAQIEGGAPRVSSLRDAVRASAIVEACYRSRQPLALPWEACALS